MLVKYFEFIKENVQLPKIFNNDFYKTCIELAKMSKSENQRYGAILVKDNEIIGKGFNRAIAHATFKLDRIIKQGYVNHAEAEAMNDALTNGYDITSSDIYVAGYFATNKTLFFKSIFTCPVCVPYFEKYQISNIYVPTPEGWIKRSTPDAKEDASNFKNNRLDKRLNVLIGDYKIDQI